MNIIAGFFLGAFSATVVFGVFKFTPQVNATDVERAIFVCKEGKWQSINNTDIICEDGAVYSRFDRS